MSIFTLLVIKVLTFSLTLFDDTELQVANHQYWCPLCPYACQRAISLWKHYSRNHESGGGGGSRRRSPVIASSKLRRVISPEPTVTTLSPTQTVTTPITSLFGSTTIVTPISTQQQCNGRVILSDKLQVSFFSNDYLYQFYIYRGFLLFNNRFDANDLQFFSFTFPVEHRASSQWLEVSVAGWGC
ncbi:unnamed protein product [Trichobilharzia regenti]|nr:unnamed protein product [Trichobilharzia regenti]